MTRSDAIAEAVRLAGGPSEVARARGYKAVESVLKWMRDGEMPVEHVIPLSELCAWQVTPHQLEPDLYPHAEDGLPPERRTARRAAARAQINSST